MWWLGGSVGFRRCVVAGVQCRILGHMVAEEKCGGLVAGAVTGV